MPAAEQTAAVTFWQSAALSTKLSLITVEAMFALLTQIGTNRTAGCWPLPATGDGGEVVPLTRAVGGVWPARRTVASATAACASRETALETDPHWEAVNTFGIPAGVAA